MDKSLKLSKHDMTPYTFHLHSSFAQLLALIRRGHYEDVIELLRREPQLLKLRDRMGRSALHHCVDCWPLSINRPNINADIGKLLIKMMPTMVEWQDQEGNIALHLAVINGDIALVRHLLRSMSAVQINIADYELHTVIHWAVVSGQLVAMTMAMEHGANPSTPDIYGAYPLHYATQNFLDMTTGSNVITNKNGSTRHLQAQQSHEQQFFGSSTYNLHQLEPIPLLFPDINSKSSQQQSSSQRRADSLRILHHLLTRPQIDVNCIDNEQRTPLIWSASSGNHDALLVLVKAGAEISQQDKDGLSALHCASSRGHYRCVHTLITMCGADVHQLDSGGCTPLFYAVALGHPDCVRLLLESGAQLDHQDHKGRTAAHCGASKGQLETLKILQEHGANLWLKNVRGDLPLHDAVKSGRVDLVKWFLDQSPESVNEVNLCGRSPLHIAAFNHNLEICSLLVSYGAHMNPIMKVRNQYLTPLDAALQNGSVRSTTASNLNELLDYLRRQGAQPLSQIDRHLADQNDNNFPMEMENTTFQLSPSSNKNISITNVTLQQHDAPTLDTTFSRIKSRRSQEVKIQDNETDQHRKSKSKLARFDDDQSESNFSTKLPNLVNNHQTNGQGVQTRAVSSKSESSSSPPSSSPPNSVVHSATAHHHHHHFTDRMKNIREYDTVLENNNGPDGETKHPTHLKQAIITNVYLTTTAPIAAATGTLPLTSLENNENTTASGTSIATGTALLPVYYVKRVPPLKKLSSSSSSQKRTKKLKKSRVIGDGQISVILETHDTFQSVSGDVREQHTRVQDELSSENNKQSRKKSIKLYEDEDKNENVDVDKDEEDDKIEDNQSNKSEYEKDEEIQESVKFSETISGHIMDEKTPDSGFENEEQHRKILSVETKENEAELEMKRKSLSSLLSSESNPADIKRKDSKSWIDSKIELSAEKTKEAINDTVDHFNENIRSDSKDSRPEIPHELIQRDFVQSFNNDNEDENIDDNSDDERRKRSISNILDEPKLKAQKSVESLQSPKLSTVDSIEDEVTSTKSGHDVHEQNSDKPLQMLIINIEQKVPNLDEDEPRIVEVTDDQDKNNKEEFESETLDDQIKQDENINHDVKTDSSIPPDLPEVNEIEIKQKEIKFKVIDDTPSEIIETDITGMQSEEAMDTTREKTIDDNSDVKSFDDGDDRSVDDALHSIKSVDSTEFKVQESIQTLDDQIAKIIDSSAPSNFVNDNEENEQKKSLTEPKNRAFLRRNSYTKGSIEINENQQSIKQQSSINDQLNGATDLDNMDYSENKLNSNQPASSTVFESSFGPVRQLKGKKKSYDYVRPKVDSYWSDDYHRQNHHQDRSLGPIVLSGKHGHCKHHHHHHDKHGGSMGYLASSSHDEYARIDPKIINQTVEKYLRKYYLERQLFEELYDLKRYQIRTGRTNEPQSVRRLVDRFRREMKAPGMSEFKGPYTYRAYEMYLYDLLRQLSRSNQKKLAYMTKSLSYDDLATSFERLQSETEAAAQATSCDQYQRHKRQNRTYYSSKNFGTNASDVSSDTSDIPNDHHEYGNRKSERESATARHSKFDPLLDYDRHPHGLVVDYKYEYHKSQHRRRNDTQGELVDVICENLYKSTGLNGSKMDEMAVSRKIIQRSGQEDNDNETNNGDHENDYKKKSDDKSTMADDGQNVVKNMESDQKK
ncbi:ankyrin repeat domain containing protein [Dermatophagoides farinae]|uniref:Ankyrin repeat domain containing protein n=1 Tax=Dermatophagoides farinae TaxID=6954 RepID=A0A9D4SL99_DERFA|nr:ankyrin repeat domain containing protein [Dermatophagoides farinae]